MNLILLCWSLSTATSNWDLSFDSLLSESSGGMMLDKRKSKRAQSIVCAVHCAISSIQFQVDFAFWSSWTIDPATKKLFSAKWRAWRRMSWSIRATFGHEEGSRVSGSPQNAVEVGAKRKTKWLKLNSMHSFLGPACSSVGWPKKVPESQWVSTKCG